jgi:hypothetical protein
VAPDQEPDLLALDLAADLAIVLLDLDIRLELEFGDDPLEHRPHPLRRLRRQPAGAVLGLLRHRASVYEAAAV